MSENIFLNELQGKSWQHEQTNLTDYFKPENNKNVRKDVHSTVQNEPIIETTTSQDKEFVAIEEDEPFHLSDDFCFPTRKSG